MYTARYYQAKYWQTLDQLEYARLEAKPWLRRELFKHWLDHAKMLRVFISANFQELPN